MRFFVVVFVIVPVFRNLFFDDSDDEERITNDIPAPHPLWLLDESVEPFQGVLLPP